MKVALLVPIYEPEADVPSFLSNFKEGDFDYFLAVDDGSGPNYKKVFEDILKTTRFEVFSYLNNQGKGAAIKEGINYLLNKYKDIDGIVTCDSDGQHCYEDVLAVKEAGIAHKDHLILGEREFHDKNIPWASRFGNHYSSFYCRCLTGENIEDTQTGLRFIPKRLFSKALKTSGKRFEYEMRFLLSSLADSPFDLVLIQTIYEKTGGHKTHFRKIYDSVLCYWTRFQYIIASLFLLGVEVGLYVLFSRFVFPFSGLVQLLLSSLSSFFVVGLIHFTLLSYLFPEGRVKRRLARYLIFGIISFAMIFGLTYLVSLFFFPTWLFKVIFELLYSLASFWAILSFVIKDKKANNLQK